MHSILQMEIEKNISFFCEIVMTKYYCQNIPSAVIAKVNERFGYKNAFPKLVLVGFYIPNTISIGNFCRNLQ